MSRFKTLLLAATMAGAFIAFVRNRLSEPTVIDRGGWKPVDPPR
ncbi:MAG TPA: hypothetical protein VK088_09805 [Acidimicrobiia bacterium]|nr:hypothetical protein [Acidimicrobiia bacterium]